MVFVVHIWEVIVVEQRVIDANALRERLLVLRCNIADVQCISDIFDICLTEVSNAPTINTYTEEEVQEIRRKVARQFIINKRPQGAWIVVNQDNEGIHEIKCPFCQYSKGSDFSSILTVTFERLPPFCEKCGSELGGDINDASIGTT